MSTDSTKKKEGPVKELSEKLSQKQLARILALRREKVMGPKSSKEDWVAYHEAVTRYHGNITETRVNP